MFSMRNETTAAVVVCMDLLQVSVDAAFSGYCKLVLMLHAQVIARNSIVCGPAHSHRDHMYVLN